MSFLKPSFCLDRNGRNVVVPLSPFWQSASFLLEPFSHLVCPPQQKGRCQQLRPAFSSAVSSAGSDTLFQDAAPFSCILPRVARLNVSFLRDLELPPQASFYPDFVNHLVFFFS